ncbi:hypothetical protein VP01_6024g1, partial [Puccinia sorghi]
TTPASGKTVTSICSQTASSLLDLIADSGFPTKTTLVPAFKKTPQWPILQLKKKINQHLASLRVCKKYCIGILKGRFQSLCVDRSLCGPPQLSPEQ